MPSVCPSMSAMLRFQGLGETSARQPLDDPWCTLENNRSPKDTAGTKCIFPLCFSTVSDLDLPVHIEDASVCSGNVHIGKHSGKARSNNK